MAKRTRKVEWVDCPGETIAAGDYIRQVRPYQNNVVHRAIDVRTEHDWIHCEVVKKDGTRNRAWSSTGGLSSSLTLWVKIRAVPVEG
jgi:hypothetical protein